MGSAAAVKRVTDLIDDHSSASISEGLCPYCSRPLDLGRGCGECKIVWVRLHNSSRWYAIYVMGN
jgi:hypothetical protein